MNSGIDALACANVLACANRTERFQGAHSQSPLKGPPESSDGRRDDTLVDMPARLRKAYKIPPCVRMGVKWLGESRNQKRSHSSSNERMSSEV